MRSLIVKNITSNNSGDVQIDGVKCTKQNAYRSTVDGSHYYNSYIGQSGSIVTNNDTSDELITIAPFLNVGGEQLENSDFYYSATLNLKDFYTRYKNDTLSALSPLFNQLNINKEKSKISTINYNETEYYRTFTLKCGLDKMYSVTVTPAIPTKAYSYGISRNMNIYKKEYLHNLRFQTTNKMIKFPRLGSYHYYKIEDINFNITISKLYEDITTTETE